MVLACTVNGFADWFTDNVFPVITVPYAKFTSLFPFSVGERMLVLLVLIVMAVLVCLVIRLVFLIIRKEPGKKLKQAFSMMKRGLLVLFSIVAVIMVMNCFVLYHCTPLKVSEAAGSEHSMEELVSLRDFLVNKCNEMAKEMKRDEDGNVIFEGSMQEEAGIAMENLSDKYRRLDGFYATPKPLTFSWFMSQQYMQGYYFPFSMEANYNDDMYIMNKPFTMCHELAHTHGYIYEDEANFLGYIGCILSGDEVFEYSGYLGVLIYVNNDFFGAVSRDEYDSHVAISDEVKYDLQFLTKEAWEKVEKESILDTDTVKKAADTFIDTNLKVNGVSSGKVSYSHVVSLLMDYYLENPYNQG